MTGGVQTVDRGHDARRSGASGEQALRAVEDLRGRHANAVGLQTAHRAERLLHQWQLHDDLIGELGELLTLPVRARGIDDVHGGEDRSVDQPTQLGEVRAGFAVGILDEQRGRGEDAVEHAVRRAPRDVVGAGGGEVDLHASGR